MKRSGLNFLYAMAVYSGISIFLITAQLLLAGALVYLLFHAVSLWRGPDGMLLAGAAAYHSAGFAFLTATNTILQYYLASLLSHNLRGRLALFATICVSAAISSAFFLRLSARSSFGSYAFAALPLIVSYLMGAIMGLFQKESENPFRHLKLNIFRLD